MPSGHTHDFFVSRRGGVSAVAQEVVEVLTGAGYTDEAATLLARHAPPDAAPP